MNSIGCKTWVVGMNGKYPIKLSVTTSFSFGNVRDIRVKIPKL